MGSIDVGQQCAARSCLFRIDDASANLDSDELEPGAGYATNHGRVSLRRGQVQSGIKAALRTDHL